METQVSSRINVTRQATSKGRSRTPGLGLPRAVRDGAALGVACLTMRGSHGGAWTRISYSVALFLRTPARSA